jgi:hypothetical protein
MMEGRCMQCLCLNTIHSYAFMAVGQNIGISSGFVLVLLIWRVCTVDWDLYSMITYFNIIFWHVVTDSDWDELTRLKSWFPHLLLVSSRTWLSGAGFHAVRLITFILCGMRFSFSHLMFSFAFKLCLYFIKSKLWGFLWFLRLLWIFVTVIS